MFHFACTFAFLLTFRLSNQTPKITWILTLYQANAATLTLFSKGDKILIKNLYECKGYNARQFISKFLNKGWTKNSINRLLVKFGTVDRRLSSGRRSAHTDENVANTVESLLLSQEDKSQSHPTVREISRGDPSVCMVDVTWVTSGKHHMTIAPSSEIRTGYTCKLVLCVGRWRLEREELEHERGGKCNEGHCTVQQVTMHSSLC